MLARDIDPATLERLRAATGGLPGEREAVLAQLRRMDLASAEPGLCGRLRRAVAKSARPIRQLADAMGVPSARLQEFLEGQANLDSAALERLAAHLELTLVYTRDPLAVEQVAH